MGKQFSASAAVALLAAALLVALPWHAPTAQAGSLAHTNGDLRLVATDEGAFHDLFWGMTRQTAWDGLSDWMGLVLDHDGYDHTAADGDGTFVTDFLDGDWDNAVSPIFWERNTGTEMKSLARYNHTLPDPLDGGPPVSAVNDVDVTQAVYTVQGKSWAILEFAVENTLGAPLTNLYGGLYLAVSHRQGNNNYGGLGGDSRDETDGWDAASGTLWVRDDAGTTLGIASALSGTPLDQHYADDGQGFFQPGDDALYAASNLNQVVGAAAGNRYVLTGFNVGSLMPGETAVLPFVLAFNTSEAAVIANDLPDARTFYFFETVPIVLSELQDAPTPRVEVYNDWDSPVDLSGWSLTATSGTLHTYAPGTVLAANAHLTATVPAFGGEADEITLLTDAGIPVDAVAYGWLGAAPDPVAGLSTARVWDPGLGTYSDAWTAALQPGDVSFGAQNPVPAADDLPYLVLNEVSFNPSAGCGGFVELRYTRDTGTIDFAATPHYLVGDAVYAITGGTVDTLNPFRFVDTVDYPAAFDLDPGSDNLYLFDDQGQLLDQVGWNGPHGVDTTVARVPEGSGTHDGYDDPTSVAAGWVFDAAPTYARWIALEPDQQSGGDPGIPLNYTLTLRNYQVDPDLVDFVATSTAGWPVALLDGAGTPLGDANQNGLPDLTAPAFSSTPVVVRLAIPPVSAGDFDNTTIGALSVGRSGACPAGYDEATLASLVFPHLGVSKVADPDVIELAGQPNDTATVTVQLRGGGVPQVQFFQQDTVFLIDSSGSMAWNDPDYLRLEAVDLYLRDMTPDDRAAVIAFGHDYDLEPNPTCTYIPPFWSCNFISTGWLTDDMASPSSPGRAVHHLTPMDPAGLAALQADLATLGPPDHPPIFSDPQGGTVGPPTNIEHAMQFAHQELIPGYTADPTTTWFYANGQPQVAGRLFPAPAPKGNASHTWVEILVTDGLPTHPTFATVDEVDAAAWNGVRIFTVGLLGNLTGNARAVAEDYLRSIADQTGGKYFFADKPEDLAGIYSEIGTVVRDVAAQDPDPSDPSVAMITDVLPDYVELVSGSLGVTTGTVTTVPATCVPGQVCTIRWKLSSVSIGQAENLSYQIRSTLAGLQNITRQPDSAVRYVNWNGSDVSLPMPDEWITVIGPVPDVEPPTISDVSVSGGDVTIAWQPSPSSHVDYYEVFGGPTPTALDLALPLGTTTDAGTLSWTHVGGAAADEYYYVVRAVNVTGAKASVTSNTAGFFAVDLVAGLNAFSLPLQPFVPATASAYATAMGASDFQWMDAAGRWQDLSAGDPVLGLGQGYLATLPSASRFHLAGEPAAMVRYQEGWGFDAATRASLTAAVDANGDVSLNWSAVPGADAYTLLISPTRRGFHEGAGLTTIPGLGTPGYVHAGGAANDGVWYYMVIPTNLATGNGSSSYSVGVWTRTFQGHETLALPLRPGTTQSVDWYADAIPNVLGIDFLLTGYWVGHVPAMPAGVYDTDVLLGVGYQITVSPGSGRYSFVGW